jgi:putative ABC transport system permease protein
LTLTLLFGSMLLLSAVDQAVNGAMGFDKDRLLVARVALPEGPYAEPERRRQFAAGVLDRVRAIPAVSRAAMVSNIPYTGGNTSRQFYPDGDTLTSSEARPVDYRRATPDYCETLGIPLLAGRSLHDGDRDGTQAVAVVSQSLVDRYWPQQDPLGRSFRLAADGPPITVVGVVGDVLHDWFQRRRAPTVYRPSAQDAPLNQTFVVRTVGDPMRMAGDVRRAVAAVDADQPILLLQTMDAVIADRTAGLTYISGMITVVAGIALALALMGLYSLMAYIISRRTQELGVRLALGATRWQIVALTTRAGLRVTGVGLILGAALAFAAGRLMESALYGVVVLSVPELALVIAAVAVVSVTATYLPTRSAARLDPVAALRAE